MGLIDDIKGLPALPRLIAQTIVAILVALFLLNRDLQVFSFGSQLANDVIVVVWIVAICNSINFFDNLDGGAAGTVAVSTLGIALIAANQGQELITALSVVTCGATVGFLLWNKSPAKIYMGDAGALFLGVLVAVLTIRLDPGISPQFNSISNLAYVARSSNFGHVHSCLFTNTPRYFSIYWRKRSLIPPLNAQRN